MRRQVYDKRTLRRMNRLSFEAGIAAYIDEAGIQLQNVSSFTYGGGGIRVLARKRPLFDHEVQNGEFDVIRVTKEGVVVHSCLMKADLRAPFLANHFCPVEAMSETVNNDQACSALELGELVRIAASGGSSACCMFGQTGSGKTHTMKAVLETVAGMLFPGGAPPHAGDGSGGASSSRTAALLRQLASECTINLACYEVCGKACHDLLAGRSKVKIQEDARGSFQVSAQRVNLADAGDFWRVMRLAMRERRTCATARNAGSSRSHAFYHLTLRPAGARHAGGSLMFVDLAGSERAADSAGHDAAQAAQSAEINSGINVLKECFRMRSQQACSEAGPTHIPYRESLLTKVLRDALEADEQRARVVVVATVSPCASDTEASLNTLRHACVMAGLDITSDRELLVDEVAVPVIAPPSLPPPAAAAAGRQDSSGGAAGLNGDGGGGGFGIGCLLGGCQPAQDAVSTPGAREASGAPASSASRRHVTPMSADAGPHSGRRLTPPGNLTLAAMPPSGAAAAPGAAWAPPVKWSHGELQHWMGSVEGGRFLSAAKQLHPSVDGKALSRMPPLRFKHLCGDDERRGQQLYDLFRGEVRSASDQRAKVARSVAAGPLGY